MEAAAAVDGIDPLVDKNIWSYICHVSWVSCEEFLIRFIKVQSSERFEEAYLVNFDVPMLT